VPACAARTSGTPVERLEINGRDDTAQVLNGWGEVTANIHGRNVPRQPSGTFGLHKKSRVLMRRIGRKPG
jgi:hypothetical protein